MIDEVLRYSLVILTVLVVDDSNKYRPNPEEPPFDADASCSILRTSLESFGAAVLEVKNKNLELLHAIIEELKSREFPDSCQLLWFVFTGHGTGEGFLVKEVPMRFDELICSMSDIPIDRQAFFFECCLEGIDGIKVAKIEKQHMALYSAPPGGISIHWNGVGMMARTIAKLLNENYAETLNQFQLDLRQILLEDLVTIKDIRTHKEREEFKNKHLPVVASNMVEDISLCKEVDRALQPHITVEMPQGSCKATITVQIPKRITSFDLVSFKVMVLSDDEEVRTNTWEASFEDESPLNITVAIPRQINRSSGTLVVAAQYSNGRVVHSEPYLVQTMPLYGKPTIASFSWKNKAERKGSITYSLGSDAESEESMEKEYVEFGFRADDEWVDLGRREDYQNTSDEYQQSLTFAPSPVDVNRRLQVRVKYKDCREFVYSDQLDPFEQPATPSKFHSRMCACWKCTPKVKLSLFFLLFLLPAVPISCAALIRFDLTDQLVAIEQTILIQPHGHSVWCRGLHISEHVVDFSDYPPGVVVSAYLVDSDDALKTENITIASDKYPGMNRSIEYGEQRYLVPLNYYSDPLYLLKGSIITLLSEILLPKQSANMLSHAVVYIFDSKDEAVRYEQDPTTSAQKSVGSINVKDCVNRVCNSSYPVRENSFLFFVLSSDATAAFEITTNFTFQVLRYVYPFSPSHAWNVANISKNVSALVPLKISNPHQVVLLYTNAPNTSEIGYRLSHLNIKCAARRWLQALLIVVSFVPLLGYVIALTTWYFRTKIVMQCKRLVQTFKRGPMALEDVNSRSPLLRGHHYRERTNYSN